MDEKKSISKDGTKPAKKAASVVKSGTKSATKSTKPATKSVAKTVAKSTAKPAAKSTAKPAAKSTKPATKSAAKSTKTVATSAATSAANQAKPAAKKPSKNLPTERTLLRGWFHAGFTPLVLALGVVLITLAAVLPESNTHKLLASIEFMVCSTILFSMSAIYNIFNWGPRTKMVLRRIDHVNIFLIIAGTYSPIAVSCMPWVNPDSVFFSGRTLLISISVGCLIGAVLHVIWINAPRWVVVGVYIFLGIFSLIYIPTILKFGGPFNIAMVVLLAVGGVFYITGSVFYGLKAPLANSKIFGFHEIFHCCTIAAFICHSIVVYMAVLTGPF